MTYIPGGGGGGGNLATSGDVAFSNPLNGHVVTFNQSTSKWINAVPPAGDLSSHTAAADPHAAAKYAVMVDGGRQIFTRTTDPANDTGLTVANGDIWLAL